MPLYDRRTVIDPKTGERRRVTVEMAPEEEEKFEAERAEWRAANVPAVSAAQAMIALHDAGHLDKVEAAIAKVDYAPIKFYWQRATQWERSHPYILAIQAELGWSDEQIDSLFEAASLR